MCKYIFHVTNRFAIVLATCTLCNFILQQSFVVEQFELDDGLLYEALDIDVLNEHEPSLQNM